MILPSPPLPRAFGIVKIILGETPGSGIARVTWVCQGRSSCPQAAGIDRFARGSGLNFVHTPT